MINFCMNQEKEWMKEEKGRDSEDMRKQKYCQLESCVFLTRVWIVHESSSLSLFSFWINPKKKRSQEQKNKDRKKEKERRENVP